MNFARNNQNFEMEINKVCVVSDESIDDDFSQESPILTIEN
jgi:hypothetical protein